MLDSIVDVNKKYHPQIFLKECKYVIKKKKIMNRINEKLKSDESGNDDSEYAYPFKC